MMNIQSHIIAAIGLALMASIVHLTIRTDNNTKAMDIVRYYTLKRVPGDVAGARALVEAEDKWLSVTCQAAQINKSVSDSCIVERKTLRDNILNKMGCMSYNSQVCTYLRNLTSGLVVMRTYGATTYGVGKSLLGTVPGQGTLTYRQILWNALNNVQNLFRNSYKAQQSDDFYVLRTILYNLIVFPVLGNILVHYVDYKFQMTWSARLFTRLLIHLLCTLLPTIVFLASAGGSAMTALFWIWLPALIVLLYYEAFLDATVSRPWIHPYVFAIMYASLSLLALIESGVHNSVIVLTVIGQSHAVSMLYMQLVWYWTGYNEKKTSKKSLEGIDGTHAAMLYLTKEMQYALLLGVIAITIFPFLQVVAPFDFECGDPTIRAAPIVFLALSVFGTLYVQDMHLDDHYGLDKDKDIPAHFISDQQKRVYYATRITGGKLAVSLLLLAFATLYEFNIVGQYFRWTRAYNDRLPERAWQYDIANKFTLGTGFLPVPTLYQ